MTNPIPPSVGRIVLVTSVQWQGDIPGIVTKVHSNECVNLTLFPDNGVPHPVTSIEYAEDRIHSGLNMAFHWMDYQLKVAAERDPVTGAPST